MTITFDELRNIKHSLPTGSVRRMAERLGKSEQTIRNYFGGTDFESGKPTGLHIQPGPNGGIVTIEDTSILDLAKEIIAESAVLQG